MERRGIRAEDEPAAKPASGPAPAKKAAVSGIWEYRCHLCRLTKSHPKLVELIHERHFKDRLPYRDIMEEVNRLIAEQSLDIKPIARSSFTAHFSNHVPGDAAFLHAVQAEHEQRNAGSRPQEDEVLSAVLAFKRENIQALQSNLSRWQKIADDAFAQIEQLQRAAAEHPDGEPGSLASPLALKGAFGRFSTATQSITMITSTLDRYVNGKDFVVAVLKEGVDFFTDRLARIIGEEMAAILEEAADKKVSADDMGDWMHTRLAAAMAKGIGALRHDTHNHVADKYRLKGMG